jgi:hypothetical protein
MFKEGCDEFGIFEDLPDISPTGKFFGCSQRIIHKPARCFLSDTKTGA